MRPGTAFTALLSAVALAGSLSYAQPLDLAADLAAQPDRPAAGRSLVAETFPDGPPVPFAAVLDHLRDAAGPENVQTALIPIGRSLQRHAAAPDFFASPRLVVAITGDRAAGPGDLRLADRLFLGYQPAAEVIEAISYNAVAGRFEFEEIIGYATDRSAVATPAERTVCLECHQGAGPIFARPLWNESNAAPPVAAHLATLGDTYHGAPTRQTIDALDAFDAATDRAARLALTNRLWAEGCPDPNCRAALLLTAIRIALSGTATPEPGSPVATAFEDHTAALWPGGLAAPSPDLPNRDPFLDPVPVLDTAGPLNPETPRPATRIWQSGPGAFTTAASELAMWFSPGDLTWIDRLVGRAPAPSETVTLPCDVTPSSYAETTFDCRSGEDHAAGFLDDSGTGRLDRLRLDGQPAPRMALRPDTPPIVAGRAARLADGRRITGVTLDADHLTLRLTDDLAVLAPAFAARAATGQAPFAAGPFDRRAALALIQDTIGGANG